MQFGPISNSQYQGTSTPTQSPRAGGRSGKNPTSRVSTLEVGESTRRHQQGKHLGRKAGVSFLGALPDAGAGFGAKSCWLSSACCQRTLLLLRRRGALRLQINGFSFFHKKTYILRAPEKMDNISDSEFKRANEM